MKKMIRIMLVAMLMLLATNRINAYGDHIFLDDSYVSESSLREMNDDLDHIENDYDIGIYFILDQSISDVESYAADFLSTNGHASSNVVLVVSSSDYAIKANGPYAEDISGQARSLWQEYNEAPTYTEGIVNYYQKVVSIINAKQYSQAAPSVSGKPSVYDGAGLLSADQLASLSSKIDQIRKKYGMDVVLVTTDDLNGAYAGDYADDFYDYNGYGKDGVLLLIAKLQDDGQWWVSTKGKGAEYFTDYGIDVIVDKMMGKLSDGRFYEAFNIFADQADYFIEQGREGNIIDIDNSDPVREPKTFGIFNGVISAVVGALSSLFSALILKGQMKSIRMERYAGSYVVDRSFVVNGSADMLVDTRISRHYNPPHRDNTGSSHPSGGGSSMHTSSSGSSHGGHGGHF